MRLLLEKNYLWRGGGINKDRGGGGMGQEFFEHHEEGVE